MRKRRKLSTSTTHNLKACLRVYVCEYMKSMSYTFIVDVFLLLSHCFRLAMASILVYICKAHIFHTIVLFVPSFRRSFSLYVRFHFFGLWFIVFSLYCRMSFAWLSLSLLVLWLYI